MALQSAHPPHPVAGKYTQPAHSDDAPYWFGGGAPPTVRMVSVDDTARWLMRGWDDLRAAPMVSLTYGGIFVVLAYLIVFGLAQMDMTSLILPLMAGFMLIGPLAAVGLYEVSRLHAARQPVSLGKALMSFPRYSGQLLVIGLALMLMLMLWVITAMYIFAIFYNGAPPNMNTFVSDLLVAPQAPLFLLVGTAAGAVLAAIVFAIGAVSLPMVVDRDVSPVHAMATSVVAVRRNWKVMIGWAAMIVLITASGMVLFFVGLAVALPLVGHASWHAYKAMVE
ncbi:DUF2189 domain-containing protein [Novispirillum sp. DQ9]|uniref:DUF2189 domain-containing protein n=1 Tax=Novispirillum sp. DQ9 TaxID=3398612 RepID=UPI003C7BF1AC